MTELTELEEGLRKLKEDNLEKRRLVSELGKEKKYLEERNKFLIEKLKQASVLYEEAGKKVMDFVNEHVKPMKTQFADFDSRLSKIKEYDTSINSALKRVAEFEGLVNGFKNEVVKTEEKGAVLTADIKEMRKTVSDLSKRISSVQTFGSEELAEKVEEIKAKSGEDVKEIEDEFNFFKMGVGNTIEELRKGMERESNSLRKDMEKVDISKAKELGDALGKLTEELNRTKGDFSKSMLSLKEAMDKLDLKKTKETGKSLDMLTNNLNERFKNFAGDLEKRTLSVEKELGGFRTEMEKSLSTVKTETRDFMDSKSKEFDELRKRMDGQIQSSISEWEGGLGEVKSDLVNAKGELEKLIGSVNRRIEIGEERREKKLDDSVSEMRNSLSERLEVMEKGLEGKVKEVSENFEKVKSDLMKTVESLRNIAEKGQTRRREDIDKMVKGFLAAKGEVDEKIKVMTEKVAEFSKISENLRKSILKESLAGVRGEVKGITEEMVGKFETVGKNLAEKIASVESDVDGVKANLQDNVNSVMLELGKRTDSLRKEFEKRDLKKEKDFERLSESLQKDIEKRFDTLREGTKTEIKGMGDEVDVLRKNVDNFTVDLKEKFGEIVKEKSKEFGVTVNSLVGDMKKMEREVNLVINAFKKDIEGSEAQRREEIDKILKEFIVKRGEVGEKIKQLDLKISEFSKASETLRKEILKESLAGVNERVKGIAEEVKSGFDSSRKDMERGAGEFMENTNNRVREVETALDNFRVDLEKTVGKLREDVDKVTGRKTGEMDKIAEKLGMDVDEKMKSVTSEISENVEMMRHDIVSARDEFQKSLASLRKDFELREAKREAKVEKTKEKLDKEVKERFDDLVGRTEGRMKILETDMKSLKSEIDNLMGRLRDKFEGIIEEKSQVFETVIKGVVDKSERVEKDVESLADGLKAEFQKGEKQRWIDLEKSVKELMTTKGEVERGLKEVTGEIKKFSGIRDDLKNEVMKESSNLIDNLFSSLSGDMKVKVSDTRKSFGDEIKELKFASSDLEERLVKMGDKIVMLKEQLLEMKKSRNLLLGEVKSINKTAEGNVDSKLRNFLKDLEKQMKVQEKLLNSRMENLEKEIESVSGKIAKTKKEKEEQLDELIKHVES